MARPVTRRRKEIAEPATAAPVRWRRHLAAAAVLLAVLAWYPRATVVSEPGGRFEDPDAAFHAHRAARAVAERTFLPPVFDSWENFPEGGRAVWPPLHDALLGLLARLGGSRPDRPEAGLGFAGVFPVLELLGLLVAAALLAQRAGGDRGAAVAAWLVATSPVLLARGAYGSIDHNVTELLGALLLALLAGKLAALRGKGAPVSPLLWGGAVLLALGFYAGLVLSAAAVAGGVLLAEAADGGERRAGPALAAGFAAAALVLPLFASLRVHPDPSDPWRLGPVYAFLLALAALASGLLALARGAGPRGRALLVVGALAAGAAAALLQPAGTLRGVARGLGFVGSRDVWLSGIEEFRPVWTTPASLLALLPVVPVALLALALGAARLKERRAALLPVLVPFAGFLLLAIVQKRFLPLAAVFGAAAAGALWADAAARPAARWALLGTAAAGLVLARPSPLTFLGETIAARPAPEVTPAEAAARALSELTPDPGSPPAWGVLAPWDYGHLILRVGHRAVALNNFGNFHPGFDRKLAIFLETSPAKAVAALDRDRLRYVVAAYPPNVVPSAAAILGRDPRAYFLDGWSPDRVARYEVTPEGGRTLLVRLHLRDGRPFPDDSPADRAALARFRKIAEWEEAPGPGGAVVPFMRIFELLPPGAPAAPAPAPS